MSIKRRRGRFSPTFKLWQSCQFRRPLSPVMGRTLAPSLFSTFYRGLILEWVDPVHNFRRHGDRWSVFQNKSALLAGNLCPIRSRFHPVSKHSMRVLTAIHKSLPTVSAHFTGQTPDFYTFYHLQNPPTSFPTDHRYSYTLPLRGPLPF